MCKQYCYLIIVHIDKGKESAMAKKDLTGERHGDLVVLPKINTLVLIPEKE